MAQPWTFSYRPRYAATVVAGEVTEAQAFELADAERAAYAQHVVGLHGPAGQDKARVEGLGGIVEMRAEVDGGTECLDMVVGKRYFRPNEDAPRKPGRRF